MQYGTVKWYEKNKGYGFIIPDDGGKDVFVHVTAVEKSGLKTLQENDPVSYDLEERRGRTSAVNIKVQR